MSDRLPSENTAKIGFLIARGVPEESSAPVPIGYWPEDVLKEARRRGCVPVIRYMWPDEMEGLFKHLGAKAVASEILSRLPAASPLPRWAKVEEYARHVKHSRSWVFAQIKKGLPYRGGRIPVREADEFIKAGGLRRRK